MTDNEMLRLAKGLCGMMQNDKEILWAVDRLREHTSGSCKYFLEIGCHEGGSLLMWSQALSKDGVLIGMTLHNDPETLHRLVCTVTGKEFFLINEPSELDSTKQTLVDFLDGEQLGGVFFDSGPHTLNQVAREFNLYKPLLGKPSVMMFHDIMLGTAKRELELPSCAQWWLKMKNAFSYEEKRIPFGWRGIGIIFLEEEQ